MSTARPNSSEFFGRSDQLFWSQRFFHRHRSLQRRDRIQAGRMGAAIPWRLQPQLHRRGGAQRGESESARRARRAKRNSSRCRKRSAKSTSAILSNNYDFISSRVGIQPFVSDFRGFIFNDTNLGVRIFGNYDNNRWQYNVAAFDMLREGHLFRSERVRAGAISRSTSRTFSGRI